MHIYVIVSYDKQEYIVWLILRLDKLLYLMQAHSANLSSIKLNFGGERAGNSPVDARFNL